MNNNEEARPMSLRVSLFSRFGEQVFNYTGTRLEKRTMESAVILQRYLNQYKEDLSREV